MKRIFTVLLTLLLIVNAVPFAFAQAAAPLTEAYLSKQSNCILLVLSHDVGAPTADFCAEVAGALKGGGTLRLTLQSDALLIRNEARQADAPLYAMLSLGDKPFSMVHSLQISAGSFSDRQGGAIPAFGCGTLREDGVALNLTGHSRLSDTDRDNSPAVRFGAGDAMTLRGKSVLPLSVFLDGEALCDLVPGDVAVDFSTEVVGTHTVTAAFAGRTLYSETFTVASQKELARENLLESLGGMLYSPLAALVSPALLIIPGLGPLLSFGTLLSPFEAVPAFFRALKAYFQAK